MAAVRRPVRLLALLFLIPLAGSCAPLPEAPMALAPDLVHEPPARAVLCAATIERSDHRTIGPAGDSLSVGRHRLVVPPGTVNTPTPFRMVEPSANYITLWFQPFANPNNRNVRVTMSTARCGADQPSALAGVVRWFPQEQRWVPLPADSVVLGGSPRAGELTATFTTDRFSHYALVTP